MSSKKLAKKNATTGAKYKCTPALIKRAYDLSAAMLLDCQIIECLAISKETFYLYKRTEPDFSEALRKGFADSLEQLTKNAIERAKTDPVMQMFLLKNKGKHIEHQQKINLKIKQKELKLKEKELREKIKLDREKFEYIKNSGKNLNEKLENVFEDVE